MNQYDSFGFLIAESPTENDYRSHEYSLDESAQTESSWTKLLQQESLNLQAEVLDTTRKLMLKGVSSSVRETLWSILLGTRFLKANSGYNYEENMAFIVRERRDYEQVQELQRIHFQEQVRLNSLAASQSAPVNLIALEDADATPDSVAPCSKKPDAVLSLLDLEITEATVLDSPSTTQAKVKRREQFHASMHQIKLDLDRTFPTHKMFSGDDNEGREKLFNVLALYAKYNPDVGYCQGMSSIAAMLLMTLDEETTFWALVSLFERPKYLSGYYDTSLHRIQHHADVFSKILELRIPELWERLTSLGIHPLMYTVPWFMCMFTSLPCWDTVLCIWDMLMLEGIVTIFRVAITIMTLCKEELLAMDSVDQILPYLQHPPVNRIIKSVFAPKLYSCDISKAHVDAAEAILAAPAAPGSACAADALSSGPQVENIPPQAKNTEDAKKAGTEKPSRFKRLLSNITTPLEAMKPKKASAASVPLADKSNSPTGAGRSGAGATKSILKSRSVSQLGTGTGAKQQSLQRQAKAKSFFFFADENSDCSSGSGSLQASGCANPGLNASALEHPLCDSSPVFSTSSSARAGVKPTAGEASQCAGQWEDRSFLDDSICLDSSVVVSPSRQSTTKQGNKKVRIAPVRHVQSSPRLVSFGGNSPVRVPVGSPARALASGTCYETPSRRGFKSEGLPDASPFITPSARRLIKDSPNEVLSFREFNTPTPLRRTQTKAKTKPGPVSASSKRALAHTSAVKSKSSASVSSILAQNYPASVSKLSAQDFAGLLQTAGAGGGSQRLHSSPLSHSVSKSMPRLPGSTALQATLTPKTLASAALVLGSTSSIFSPMSTPKHSLLRSRRFNLLGSPTVSLGSESGSAVHSPLFGSSPGAASVDSNHFASPSFSPAVELKDFTTSASSNTTSPC